MLADYASRGDDPAVLISLEDAGYLIECAARRIRKAIDQLEAGGVPLGECGNCSTPFIDAGAVLRCIWCGQEERGGRVIHAGAAVHGGAIALFAPAELTTGTGDVADVDQAIEEQRERYHRLLQGEL